MIICFDACLSNHELTSLFGIDITFCSLAACPKSDQVDSRPQVSFLSVIYLKYLQKVYVARSVPTVTNKSSTFF